MDVSHWINACLSVLHQLRFKLHIYLRNRKNANNSYNDLNNSIKQAKYASFAEDKRIPVGLDAQLSGLTHGSQI